MRKRTIAVAACAVVLSTGLAGGVALAAGGDSGDQNVTGPDADRAVAAALADTGASRANAVERDSENGAVWEVEVAMPDGSTQDVRLDGNFHVVVVEHDSDSAQHESGSDR